jgi:flagellar biosynthetic protein FliP
MLLQSMGIMAALAFVLGLVGIAVWVAKRFGAIRVNPRSRVPVEIVQRLPFGPKASMAVIRVGEKVMAVSIGPDGIRPLFELDEADRVRVIATSQVATPFASSVDASKAFAKFLPAGLGGMFGGRTALANAVTAAPSMLNTAFTAPVAPEIPAFVVPRADVAVPTTRSADRDFRNVLGIAMTGATRLAVFVGFIALSVASASAHAQAAPPTNPPVPPVATPATTPVQTPTTTPATTVAPASNTSSNTSAPVGQTVPAPPVAPTSAVVAPSPNATAPAAFAVPKGVPRAPRTATVRPANPRAITPAKTIAPNITPGTTPNATPSTAPNNAPAAGKLSAANASTAQNGKQTSTINTRTGTGSNAAVAAPIAGADDALAKMIPQMDLKMGEGKDGGLHLSGTVGIVVMMGLLTLVPTLLLMMTGFTRILIVLHFLKQAMGTQAAPPAQLLAAMALLLTGFVMAPTLREVNSTALEPWMEGRMTQVQMLQVGVKPLRTFMLKQTREADLKTFIQLSRLPRPNTVDDVPLHVLMSAFVASELRTAFQIGFAIYLPFIVIDAVVASVLMSMGMFMLPPAMISMPFKLLLFVLVDGWSLTIQSLVQSFK